jgi:hypothetical protein
VVSPDSGQDRTGGGYLLEFVGSELAREENRRSSLETRGQSVAALAAGIVALITALRQFAGLPTFDMGKARRRACRLWPASCCSLVPRSRPR